MAFAWRSIVRTRRLSHGIDLAARRAGPFWGCGEVIEVGTPWFTAIILCFPTQHVRTLSHLSEIIAGRALRAQGGASKRLEKRRPRRTCLSGLWGVYTHPYVPLSIHVVDRKLECVYGTLCRPFVSGRAVFLCTRSSSPLPISNAVIATSSPHDAFYLRRGITKSPGLCAWIW
jgi:hypothetical protein